MLTPRVHWLIRGHMASVGRAGFIPSLPSCRALAPESSSLSLLGLLVTSAACRTGFQAAEGVVTPAQELVGKVEPQA